MANVQKLKGSSPVSTTAVTIYENLNFGEHRGTVYFDNFVSGDVYNFTVEILDLQSSTYKVVKDKDLDFTAMNSFKEKGVEFLPRVADQIRIKFKKVSGNDRTLSYTMYTILIT